jgi:hypothetical protein
VSTTCCTVSAHCDCLHDGSLQTSDFVAAAAAADVSRTMPRRYTCAVSAAELVAVICLQASLLPDVNEQVVSNAVAQH